MDDSSLLQSSNISSDLQFQVEGKVELPFDIELDLSSLNTSSDWDTANLSMEPTTEELLEGLPTQSIHETTCSSITEDSSQASALSGSNPTVCSLLTSVNYSHFYSL